MSIHFHKLFSPNAKKTDHANYRYVQYDVRKQFTINSSSVFRSFVYRSQTRLWNIVTPRVDIKCLRTSCEHYSRTVFVNCSPANKRFTTTLSLQCNIWNFSSNLISQYSRLMFPSWFCNFKRRVLINLLIIFYKFSMGIRFRDWADYLIIGSSNLLLISIERNICVMLIYVSS